MPNGKTLANCESGDIVVAITQDSAASPLVARITKKGGGIQGVSGWEDSVESAKQDELIRCIEKVLEERTGTSDPDLTARLRRALAAVNG